MNCERVTERFPDWLAGTLGEPERAEMQAHCAACARCREMVDGLGGIWTSLGQLGDEQPSSALRLRFHAMLEAYRQGMQSGGRGPRWHESVSGWLERWWPRQPAWQVAVALFCLATGVGIGHRVAASRGPSAEIVQLREEVHSTRQLVTLSLLQQSSPGERLRGVAWSARLEQPDPQVLNALLNTLNDDPNVNVRLAAADALFLYRDQPAARQGLVQSLPRQSSPLVQIALIDLLVQIDARQSVELLRRLANDGKVNQAVRQRASWGLQQLL